MRRALDIAWRHRWLWLLALLAGESGGASGSFNYRVPAGSTSSAPGQLPGQAPGHPPDLAPAATWIGEHVALLVTIGLALLVLLLVLLVISAVAEGAAVRGAAALDSGQPSGLGPAWRLGAEVFWPMLWMRVLVFLIALAVVATLAVLVGAAIAAGVAARSIGLAIFLSWQGLGLLALLIPVAAAAAAVVKLAARSLALDGTGPWQSLDAAVRLGWRRIGPVAILWVIELACSIGVALAFAVAALALIVPAVAGGIGAFGAHAPAAIVPVALYLLVVAGLLIVASAGVSAFFSVYWTVGYRRLRATG